MSPTLSAYAALIGRLIFTPLFLMAFVFKATGLGMTADFIAAAGFPAPMILAVLAAILEAALVVCLLTGAFFSEAALVAAAYVLFLGFSFHGPAHWKTNQAEFGFFVDHFCFVAGLLFAAAYGPGDILAFRRFRLLGAPAAI